LSNALLYAAYLVLCAYGMHAKTAMTLVYITGVAQTFILNRRWTFSFDGPSARPFLRYCLAYALGYLVNLLTLHLFVDVLGYRHQVVQGLAVIEVATILFVLHRFWVFRRVSPVDR
jgi:putative flippase GtrA